MRVSPRRRLGRSTSVRAGTPSLVADGDGGAVRLRDGLDLQRPRLSSGLASTTTFMQASVTTVFRSAIPGSSIPIGFGEPGERVPDDRDILGACGRGRVRPDRWSVVVFTFLACPLGARAERSRRSRGEHSFARGRRIPTPGRLVAKRSHPMCKPAPAVASPRESSCLRGVRRRSSMAECGSSSCGASSTSEPPPTEGPLEEAVAARSPV